MHTSQRLSRSFHARRELSGTWSLSWSSREKEGSLLEYGPGMSSFSACRFSSVSLALQFSHQITLSLPGELPLPEAGDPVPNPGEPPREPGDPVPIPGEIVPGDPEKELGEEIPEPGDGVPVELGIEPAPSGAGRVLGRLPSSYTLRYQVSGK